MVGVHVYFEQFLNENSNTTASSDCTWSMAEGITRGDMSPIRAAVSWGLSHVSFMARISIVLEINQSLREAIFSLEWNEC